MKAVSQVVGIAGVGIAYAHFLAGGSMALQMRTLMRASTDCGWPGNSTVMRTLKQEQYSNKDTTARTVQ